MRTRVEIYRDGLWRRLKLKDGKAIKYNALINRIGKINSREISHTNTFSLPAIFQNTDALRINLFNKTSLAKALNSKWPAKYYVEDKLLQQGFLVINNTSDGEINVNFIDKALEITEKWGSMTFNELVSSTEVTRSEDYRLAILEMTNYNMSKSIVLTPLGEVGTRGYNLALFPNALNAIGDKFQQPITGERLDNTFNPYQSRPIWNVKALFDLAVESFGYTPLYDDSVDWIRVQETYMIEEGLDKNKVENEGQQKISYPPTLTKQYRETDRPGHGYKYYIPGYHSSVDNAIRPFDIPGWIHPPNGNYFGSTDFNLDYREYKSVLKPNVASATFGEITLTSEIYRARNIKNYEHEFIGYSCWENSTSGGNVLFEPITFAEQIFEDDGSAVKFTISKNQLADVPVGSNGNLHGVIFSMKKRHRYREQFFIKEFLFNTVVRETFLTENIISYDENGQYIANNINLTHSAPTKTIRELMSAIMQKEGILLDINSKTKVVKFFSYGEYEDQKNIGNFNDWSDYFQEYVSPQFNTDYGDAYAKKNEIGLSNPYLGNTYDFFLENQDVNSKYKDFEKNTVELFKDVQDIKRINNTISPYYEYTNLGLGLVEKTNTISGIVQVSSDGLEQGIIPELQLVANVNYSTLPLGVREWYELVDRAIRGSSTFILPVNIISTLDISKPVYINDLGGYFIIEEIEEYIDGSTPVQVKLIKLIDDLGSDITLPISSMNLAGSYVGESTYIATLSKMIVGLDMEGSYIGESIYSAALDLTFDNSADMEGYYIGESIYGATLDLPKFYEDMQGYYVGESQHRGRLDKNPITSIPTLQQVTTAGNISTNIITLNNGLGASVNLYPSGTINCISPGSSYFIYMEAPTCQIGGYNGTNFKTILQFPAASAQHVINIPNKAGTFALLDDIVGGGYTHPTYTTRSIIATGASVLSTFTSDAIGSVTGITTRTLTPANIGAEVSLGNPSVSGYVLSSTTAGVRSWIAPAGGGGATNLTTTHATTTVTINSDTGTDAVINAATASLAGVVTNAAQTFAGAKTFISSISTPDLIGTSDIRLKENIKQLIPRKLKTDYKSFNFIENEQDERIGVIAQELEKENPEFVRTNEDGIKSVSYIDLHSAEIAYLKEKVEYLESLILLIAKQ